MAELMAQIAQLSVADRLQLLQEILKTISIDTGQVIDYPLSEVQKAELDRRWETVKNGTANTVNWESIESKIEQRYGK